MDKRIENILNDLYRIDPTLKAHEQELISLVSNLILAKPDTKFDETFASQLRAELLETKIRPMPSPYRSFFVSRAFYSVVGSAITILVVVPFTFIATQRATSPEKPVVLNPFSAPPQVKDLVTGLTPKQQISNKGTNAFGTLAILPVNQAAPDVTPNNVSTRMGISASAVGGPVATGTATAPVRNGGSNGTFSYKGEQLTLKNKEGQVYKRTKGIDSGKQLADMIQSSNFGLTKLSSFSDLRLSTLELNETKTNGYSISINFNEGAIAISPQWLIGNAKTQRDKPSTTADPALVTIADDFVREHAINMSVYGKGVIIASDADIVSVVYPLIIQGEPVHEEAGIPFGLYVSIDAHLKKVSGVNNLTSQTYDGSTYSLETNFSAIVNAATSTLASTIGGQDPGVAVTGTLGTPEHVLMHHWVFDSATGNNNELYIPALSFPVTYSKNSAGLPPRVIVPLVKDFLGKQPSGKDAATSSPR
jgi:hypothetical protein